MEPPTPGIWKLKPSPTKSEIDELYDIFFYCVVVIILD